MKIKDQEIRHGKIVAKLKDTSIDMLENMPSGEGVEAAKKQMALAKKLKACNGVLEIEPEDAVLIRQLINRAAYLPPVIQIGLYEAFDPDSEDS